MKLKRSCYYKLLDMKFGEPVNSQEASDKIQHTAIGRQLATLHGYSLHSLQDGGCD